MQLAELGLVALVLQFCIARHAHTYLPRHQHASDVDSRPAAVFTRSTTSLFTLEADVEIHYQKVLTTISAARPCLETPLGKQYRTDLQPTDFGQHHYLQSISSQGWTGTSSANSTTQSGNRSSPIHRLKFYSTATPLATASLKPSSLKASAGGTPKNFSSFPSSGSHGRRYASRFAVPTMIMILAGAALFGWS